MSSMTYDGSSNNVSLQGAQIGEPLALNYLSQMQRKYEDIDIRLTYAWTNIRIKYVTYLSTRGGTEIAI